MGSKQIITITIVIILTISAINLLHADVVTENMTKIKFHGALGTAMKIFGMGKPIHTMSYYTNSIMRSDMLDKKGRVRSSEIIDLEKELFISIDHKKKRYTQMTFEEWRQQIQEAMERFQGEDSENSDDEAEESNVDWDVSFDIAHSDGTQDVNGYDTKEVIMTISVKSAQENEEGEEVEGEMKVTSKNYMSEEIEGNDQIADFNMKLAEKLGFGLEESKMKGMWEKIMQSYPQIGDAKAKLEEEGGSMTGTPVRTFTLFESIGNLKPKDDEGDDDKPSSVGGLMKGLGKKAVKKDDSGPKKLMEMHTDLLRQDVVAVHDSQFVIPEKYKLKK